VIIYKVIVDTIIMNKLSNISLFGYISQNDMEIMINESKHEINNDNELPLKLKNKIDQILNDQDKSKLALELYQVYEGEKKYFIKDSFFQKNKIKLIFMTSILFITIISLISKKFSDEGASILTQIIHWLLIGPILFLFYRKWNVHNKENDNTLGDIDYRFRNKIFVKFDEMIKQIYDEGSYEN